jgi:hypothetical protein
MDHRSTRKLNPWLSIWIRPRVTIQQIIDDDPEAWVLALAAIAGIGQALNDASSRSSADHLDLPGIFIIAVIAGPLLGILGLYVVGALLRWTGRWIGGHASQVEIRCASAWSQVPVILAMLLWIPQLWLFGSEMFTEKTPRIDADPTLQVTLLVLVTIEAVMTIWSVVVFLKCLGQVQGFSAWKALGNSILAGLVIVVPIAAAVFAAVMVLG